MLLLGICWFTSVPPNVGYASAAGGEADHPTGGAGLDGASTGGEGYVRPWGVSIRDGEALDFGVLGEALERLVMYNLSTRLYIGCTTE
jgi:hypothetical protein